LTDRRRPIITAAIIPARGGSIGIKDKNISNLGGRPLIEYALDFCHSTAEIDLVAVSTDSEAIKSVVLKAYPDTLIIDRPENLSGAFSTSEEALIHATKIIETDFNDLEKIVFVQATSPLTKSSDLSRLIKLLEDNDSACFYIDDYCVFLDLDEKSIAEPRVPRQKREPRKREVGNAWAFKKDTFLKYGTRLHGKIGMCKISDIQSLEIDENDDLLLINAVMSSKNWNQ
jgi:N-acylneuraminate cytidylyltransferase